MKVLFVSWELDPFFKIGGLGDVARDLPGALVRAGIEATNVLPKYENLNLPENSNPEDLGSISLDWGGKQENVRVFRTIHPVTKVPVLLLENTRYLQIPKNEETFIFFNLAVHEMVAGKFSGIEADIIHGNDHHAGLLPLLFKRSGGKTKSVFTIHNLAFKGTVEFDVQEKLVNPTGLAVSDGTYPSMLELGIMYSDAITTVSPTYAREIMENPAQGMGLGGTLARRKEDLYGILNGVDREYFRDFDFALPGTDLSTVKKNKKMRLQKKLGLTEDASLPLFIFIGRFDPGQKGVDILYDFLKASQMNAFQLAILAKGNAEWERKFSDLAMYYSSSLSCNFRFDDLLARELYAGADFILIPSKYEPCGLVQMIAMLNAAIPVARATGGLADSVKEGETGFLFRDYSAVALKEAVGRAIASYKENPPLKHKQMMQKAYEADFSWEKSAQEYGKVYEKLIKNNES